MSKPAVTVAAIFIELAVGAKAKNPKVGQATTNFLKSICGGKLLSLTDMHSGAGVRLRVVEFYFKRSLFMEMSGLIEDSVLKTIQAWKNFIDYRFL